MFQRKTSSIEKDVLPSHYQCIPTNARQETRALRGVIPFDKYELFDRGLFTAGTKAAQIMKAETGTFTELINFQGRQKCNPTRPFVSACDARAREIKSADAAAVRRRGTLQIRRDEGESVTLVMVPGKWRTCIYNC